ncbi:hypothetical protein NC652_005043 [Populus alba x Populus x berolinensis]|nr:hypothetical protein NC652_005043 [Populus alba x Populus x berolinensis]
MKQRPVILLFRAWCSSWGIQSSTYLDHGGLGDQNIKGQKEKANCSSGPLLGLQSCGRLN